MLKKTTGKIAFWPSNMIIGNKKRPGLQIFKEFSKQGAVKRNVQRNQHMLWLDRLLIGRQPGELTLGSQALVPVYVYDHGLYASLMAEPDDLRDCRIVSKI